MVGIAQPLLSHDPHSHVSVSELDYFKIVKQENLSETEKQKRVEAMWRIALLHFINSDLPLLLSPQDLETLDQMTQNQENPNIAEVTAYLRQKVSDFDAKINQNLNSIKKQLIISHYEFELKQRELEAKHHGVELLEQILAIQRLLQAAELDDWETVEANVPLTLVR